MNSINNYFAYINKKAEDFLFDFRWLDMISKCFSAVWHFEAVISFNLPLYKYYNNVFHRIVHFTCTFLKFKFFRFVSEIYHLKPPLYDFNSSISK